jgi:hypothetical protein
MTLNETEQLVLAYFLVEDAPKMYVDARFFLTEDFVRMFDDRIYYKIQELPSGPTSRHKALATQIVDLMIEKGALSTKRDKFGGVMHQFVPDVYKTMIAELAAANPLVAKAGAGGKDYWEGQFAALKAKSS